MWKELEERKLHITLIYSNDRGKFKERDFEITHCLAKPKKKKNLKRRAFFFFFPLHISEKGAKLGDFYHLFPSKKPFCFMVVK